MPETCTDFYMQYAFLFAYNFVHSRKWNGSGFGRAAVLCQLVWCILNILSVWKRRDVWRGCQSFRRSQNETALPTPCHSISDTFTLNPFSERFPPTFHWETDKMLILQYTVCCVAAKIVFLLLAYSPIRAGTGEKSMHTQGYIFKKATTDVGKLHMHRYKEEYSWWICLFILAAAEGSFLDVWHGRQLVAAQNGSRNSLYHF